MLKQPPDDDLEFPIFSLTSSILHVVIPSNMLTQYENNRTHTVKVYGRRDGGGMTTKP